MPQIIESVPESITRADYKRLIESVGLDPAMLYSLTFDADAILATVFAGDADGNVIPCPTEDDEFATAKHVIVIPVVDEAKA